MMEREDKLARESEDRSKEHVRLREERLAKYYEQQEAEWLAEKERIYSEENQRSSKREYWIKSSKAELEAAAETFFANRQKFPAKHSKCPPVPWSDICQMRHVHQTQSQETF